LFERTTFFKRFLETSVTAVLIVFRDFAVPGPLPCFRTYNVLRLYSVHFGLARPDVPQTYQLLNTARKQKTKTTT
jgi:hypothetical protein